MVALSSSFDPQNQIIRRTPLPLRPDQIRIPETASGSRPASRGRLKKEARRLHVDPTPVDPWEVVDWEPTADYATNDRAIFAARVASWIETYCWIRPKRGAPHRIRLNGVQQILMQFVSWRWVLGLPAKAITPKARQLGSSTFWDCLLYALCENIPAYQGAIIAHDDDGVTQLWDKIRTIKNALVRSPRGASDLVNDQDGYMKWDDDAKLFSGLIKSGDALGKGGTPSGIHFSEVANFSDKGVNPEEGITSILSAMAESPWTVEAYESTAKGKDKCFYGRCQRAKDPESNSDLTLIFLPWFLEPEYSMDWAEYRQRLVVSGKKDPGPTFQIGPEEERLRKSLATQEVPPHERSWRHRFDLSDEQLVWRRWCIANKCENSADIFKRYYPSFYDECFTASVDAAFTADTIEFYRSRARAPLVTGNIRRPVKSKPPVVIPDSTGKVRIWEYPVPHMPYIIGGDPGGLKATADPNHAYVMHKLSKKIVASFHGNAEWTEFTDAQEWLGYFYNTALIVCENNQNPAVANTLHARGYPNLYYYFPADVIDPRVQGTPGWNTNKKTRKEMIAKVRAYYNDRVIDNPDESLAAEMENFVWVAFQNARDPNIEGSYYAVSGNHDDRIMSTAMILCQLDAIIPQEAQPKVQTDEAADTERRVLAFYKEHLQKKARQGRITHL